MGEGGARCRAWRRSSCPALPGGAAPGSSRQPIWCGSCEGVGGGEGAAPHRPAINHSYVARGQGVGRGQGAATAAHTGQGREARVRCGCKSSPKCFQVKANQGAVTEHTRPHPAPPGPSGHTHICASTDTLTDTKTRLDVFYIQSCVCEGVTLLPGHTKTCAHQNYYFYVCLCSHTHRGSSAPTQVHSDPGPQRSTYYASAPENTRTHTHIHAKWACKVLSTLYSAQSKYRLEGRHPAGRTWQ